MYHAHHSYPSSPGTDEGERATHPLILATTQAPLYTYTIGMLIRHHAMSCPKPDHDMVLTGLVRIFGFAGGGMSSLVFFSMPPLSKEVE